MPNQCKTSNIKLQYFLRGNSSLKKGRKKQLNTIINHPLKLEFCANLLDNGGNKTAGARTSSQTREAE